MSRDLSALGIQGHPERSISAKGSQETPDIKRHSIQGSATLPGKGHRKRVEACARKPHEGSVADPPKVNLPDGSPAQDIDSTPRRHRDAQGPDDVVPAPRRDDAKRHLATLKTIHDLVNKAVAPYGHDDPASCVSGLARQDFAVPRQHRDPYRNRFSERLAYFSPSPLEFRQYARRASAACPGIDDTGHSHGPSISTTLCPRGCDGIRKDPANKHYSPKISPPSSQRSQREPGPQNPDSNRGTRFSELVMRDNSGTPVITGSFFAPFACFAVWLQCLGYSGDLPTVGVHLPATS